MLTLPGRRPIFAEDHDAFRDSVRRFVTAEVIPHLEDWRRGDASPQSALQAAGEAGFLGTAVPDEFGGGGTEDAGFLAVLIEETVAAGATGLALLSAFHAGVTIPSLIRSGSDADKQQWLSGLGCGDMIGIPAARGSSTFHDGRLSGLLPNVPGATLAHLLLVDLGDDAPGVAVIPMHQPGVAVTPVTANLAGNDAAPADVELDEIALTTVLPCSDLFRRDLDLWLAVVALAGARTAIGLALDYSHHRKVFGRPLAEFENTRFRLAELSAELATATSYVDTCLDARSNGDLPAADAAAARLATAAFHDRAVDQSLQLHGGYGYMREYPIAHAFADARFLRLTGRQHGDPRHVLAEGLGV